MEADQSTPPMTLQVPKSPKPPPGVTISPISSGISYQYAIERFSAEHGIYVIILLTLWVFVCALLPVDFYSHVVMELIPILMILALLITYDYTSWGKGELTLSLSNATLTYNALPKKGHAQVPPNISVPLHDIASIRLEVRSRPQHLVKRHALLFVVRTRHGEEMVLFQSAYAGFIFRHMCAMVQQSEIQDALPDLAFESTQ